MNVTGMFLDHLTGPVALNCCCLPRDLLTVLVAHHKVLAHFTKGIEREFTLT